MTFLVLDVIQRNPRIQSLIPYIINHMTQNYKKIVLNGALKKNLYIMIIDSLIKNPKVNLEYYVSRKTPKSAQKSQKGHFGGFTIFLKNSKNIRKNQEMNQIRHNNCIFRKIESSRSSTTS